MKADNINLLEFLGSSKRTFNIPVYQRNYDWKKPQCERLFKDVVEIVTMNKQSHFLGTIVYVDGEKSAIFREFIVIDGQQRLTTIMLFLKALYERIENERIQEEIFEDYLINKRAPERLRIKLKPIKSDFEVYNELINNVQIQNTESNIYKNYVCLLELIDECSLTPEEIFYGIQRLEMVYIQLDSQKENPQLIFESLNSTGLDLKESDLIRNYLLMGQSYVNQEYLYKKYWINIETLLPNSFISDFVRDYLTLKTGTIPNRSKVYDAFKIYFEGLVESDSEKFLQELLIFARYYSCFIYCNGNNHCINDKLEQLQRLKSTVVYPFLLNVFEKCYLYNEIDEKEVVQILDILITYVFRRLICDIPNNALNKIFATLHKDIEKIQEPNATLCDKMLVAFLNKKGRGIFPKDENFKESFINKDVYHFKHSKYLLERLEAYNSKEIVESDQLTIEHIMPQTLTPKWQVDLGKKYKDIHEKYLHRIGNLTLSGYNTELSNKNYEEKIQLLLDSNIYLNRELEVFETWNEESIQKRSLMLFQKAKNIWKLPDVKIISISDNDIRNEFDIMEDNNVTGREPYELNIIGEKISITSWREFFRVVCLRMYEYDGEIFKGLVKHKDFKGRRKRIITDDEDSLRNPYKIHECIYLEQHLSANDALNYSKLVVDKYEGMEDEITYKIR